MNVPNLYGVYTANIPFLDEDRSKVRPIIVLSSPIGKFGIITVLPVSSTQNKDKFDVPINDWATSNLKRPSIARTHRITALLQKDLIAYVGQLTSKDTLAVQSSLRKSLSL